MPIDIDDKRSILAAAKGKGLLGSSNGAAKRKRKKARAGKPTKDEILARIQIGLDLHANRDKMHNEIMDKFHGIYANVQKDVPGSDLPLIKTPRGQAIVDVMFSLLSIGAELGTQVLPMKSGDKEQALCTKLERGLEGIQFEIEQLTGKRPFHDGTHWFLVKGQGIWKTEYHPWAEGCPLRVVALDPQKVYPVEGDELLWVVEKREKWVGELRKHFKRTKGDRDGRKLSWRTPAFTRTVNKQVKDLEDTERITVTEYQDPDWEALLVGDDVVYIRPNLMGFIRYGIALCRHTPDEDPAWQGQGVLAPILGLLELETELLTKFGTSISLFFYKRLVAQTEDDRAIIFDGAPGEVEKIPFGAKLTELGAGTNMKEALELLGQAQSLVNLIGLPAVVFGEPPGQVQAGYPMALLLNAAKTKLRREALQLEWGLAKTQEHLLRYIDKFGILGEGIPVYVNPEDGKRGRKALMHLTDEDVAGHFRVKVTLAPKLPQDWMQFATIADRLRAPGADGMPLFDDKTILEELFEMGAPEEIQERIFEQKMMGHPEVMRHREKQWLEDWRKQEKIKPPEEQKPEELDVTQFIPPPMEEMMEQAQGPPGAGPGVPGQVMPAAMTGQPPTAPGGAPFDEQMMRQTMPPRR